MRWFGIITQRRSAAPDILPAQGADRQKNQAKFHRRLTKLDQGPVQLVYGLRRSILEQLQDLLALFLYSTNLPAQKRTVLGQLAMPAENCCFAGMGAALDRAFGQAYRHMAPLTMTKNKNNLHG